MNWKTWTMAVALAAAAGLSGCRTVGPDAAEDTMSNAKEEQGARLFLMRWNPQISSFKAERFPEGMRRLRRGEPTYMDWNAWDWRDIREGDWALWVRVGCGAEDGIVGIWRLTGEVEEATSWRGDGSLLHYAWGRIVMMQEPSATGILGAASLEKAFPEINWRGGHAGVLVESGLAERLARHVADELARAKGLKRSAFASEPPGKAGAQSVAAAMLADLCPEPPDAVAVPGARDGQD